MSLAEHLIHTCTIERVVVVSEDAYANVIRDWQVKASKVRCRLIAGSQRILSRDAQAQLLVVTTYKLLVEPSADLQPDDRVKVVATGDGYEDLGVFRLAAVLPRRSTRLHHVSAQLERIN